MAQNDDSKNASSSEESALDLIHDIAAKLLASDEDLSDYITKGLENILTLARHKFNMLPPEDVALWALKAMSHAPKAALESLVA